MIVTPLAAGLLSIRRKPRRAFNVQSCHGKINKGRK